MANTTKSQFENLILVYDTTIGAGVSNEEMVAILHEAEPTIKIQTITVYRSTIENYIISGLTGSAVSAKFKQALKSYYGSDDDEIRDDTMLSIIKDRDSWKAEATRLQAQLDIIYNTFIK